MGFLDFLKPKTKKQKLQAQYEKLMKENFELSKTDRKAADQKFLEAEKVLKKIENL